MNFRTNIRETQNQLAGPISKLEHPTENRAEWLAVCDCLPLSNSLAATVCEPKSPTLLTASNRAGGVDSPSLPLTWPRNPFQVSTAIPLDMCLIIFWGYENSSNQPTLPSHSWPISDHVGQCVWWSSSKTTPETLEIYISLYPGWLSLVQEMYQNPSIDVWSPKHLRFRLIYLFWLI